MFVSSSGTVLGQYVTSAMWDANAVSIFAGDWFSRLPRPLEQLSGGTATLFDDARIGWFAEHIGGFTGRSVLELGPLEAGHSYMLEGLGASEIVAIEGNTRAFLKCLVVKELLGLRRSRFLCGEIIESLKRLERPFDVCLASGVLYHMLNPAELIGRLSKCGASHVLLWTHYFSDSVIPNDHLRRAREAGPHQLEFEGFQYGAFRYDYGDALDWGGFCGGNSGFSYWMTRDDIVACLHHFGLGNIRIGFDDPTNPNGPSFALVASPSAS